MNHIYILGHRPMTPDQQVGRTAIFVAAGLDPERESIESCSARATAPGKTSKMTDLSFSLHMIVYVCLCVDIETRF